MGNYMPKEEHEHIKQQLCEEIDMLYKEINKLRITINDKDSTIIALKHFHGMPNNEIYTEKEFYDTGHLLRRGINAVVL